MITFITGENTFEIEQELDRLVHDFDGVAERIDGTELSVKQLPDLLMGATLFADKRLVIVKNLSENKAMWSDLVDWLPRLSDDTELVLVDTKPDKRTITYKELKKTAKLLDFEPWTDRDGSKASKWVEEQAKHMGLKLNTKSVQLIVQRVGPDQWGLFHALEKLALVHEITDQTIENVVDMNPVENVFNLFDAALRGDRVRVAQMLVTLEVSDDPYRLFALLSGQAFQLATLAVSEPSDNVAKDLGVNPYVVSKLSSVAKQLGRSGARKVIATFATADDDLKLSRADPWLLIERALMHVASR
jgi:DNA polymerase III delta subunit